MRDLAQLQKQYNRGSHAPAGRGGFGPGPRGRGMGMKGKPKELKKTVGRLLQYVGKYKGRLIVVLFCMLFTTVSSLIGGYMMAPIINRITYHITGKIPEMSAIERAADGVIEAIKSSALVSGLFGHSDVIDVTLYVIAALIILASVYFLSRRRHRIFRLA